MYPPGTLVEDMDPSYVAESNLPRILGVLSTLHAIAFFAVLARLYVRIRLVKSVARDDWTMVAATLCATGGLIMFIIQGTYGLGRHTDVLSGGEMAKINELTFWMSIISSAAGIALLKISIGLNLLRLSSERWYIWSIWASIAFVSAYSFMGMMTFFLHCKPMALHWDWTLDGTCYDVDLFIAFALINTSFNLFTDVLFAAFPVPVIWKLQMKRKTRLYLIGVLSLGYVAVAMGIPKAIEQINYIKNTDPMFDSWITFWAGCQINVGIIAACAPSLKPLVNRALHLSSYSRGYGAQSYGNSGSALRSRTGARASHMRSRNHDMYGLEELGSQDGVNDKGSIENKGGHTSATVTFYAEGSPENTPNRSQSEEQILPVRRDGKNKGIVRTTEVIVS